METVNTYLLDQSFAGQAPAPETKQRTIAVLAYPGVEILDVAGPLEVFSFANMWLQNERNNNRTCLYDQSVSGKAWSR